METRNKQLNIPLTTLQKMIYNKCKAIYEVKKGREYRADEFIMAIIEEYIEKLSIENK